VQAIGGIGKTIDQISEIAGCIAAAVEQQGAATQEIAGNVLQAAQGINEVSRDIEDVTRSSTDVGAAASQGLSSAGGLSQQAETLRHEVTQFLASVKAA
jgi:methyl-accepting chemotaxis protein